ncbi:MAG: invasin domain 3-containing protein, partial [Gemmatimonadales bacterium]
VAVHQAPAAVRLSDTLVHIPEGEQLRVVAEVVDARGYRIAGSAPLWKTADAAVATVDSLGNAAGVSPGRSTLTAVSGALQAEVPVEVLAVPASVTVIAGEDQRAPAGRPLPAPVTAQIVSRSGRPIPGVEVQFLDRGDFGAAEPAVDTSDARGMVQTAWTLGGLPGRQHLAIAVEGVSVSPVLTAEADPVAANTRVALVNEELTGTVGDTVKEPIVVRVTDSTGAALADVPVAWTAAGGGSVIPLGARTDSVGEARARWKLGPKAGRQRLRVQVGNARTVPLFSAGATAEPGAAITAAVRSGDGQSGPVGAQLAQPIVVRALDQLGNPVPGASIALTLGAGSVPDSSPRTDSTGQARVRWTLGRVAGRQELSVRLEGSKSGLEVSARGQPLRPANIAFVSAPTAATAGRPLAKPLAVEVTDAYGNAIPNLTVAFRAASGSVARARVVTDGRGRAETRWTAGRKAGEQSLVAEVIGTAVRTTLTLDVSPAAKVTR